MRCKILLIWIALSVVQIVRGSQIWEFGVDNNPLSGIITNYSGRVVFQDDKQQRINLLVPPCRVITYVRVRVNNPSASPNVYYNHNLQVVVIQYEPWQSSLSEFHILAKAAFVPNCIAPPPLPYTPLPALSPVPFNKI